MEPANAAQCAQLACVRRGRVGWAGARSTAEAGCVAEATAPHSSCRCITKAPPDPRSDPLVLPRNAQVPDPRRNHPDKTTAKRPKIQIRDQRSKIEVDS